MLNERIISAMIIEQISVILENKPGRLVEALEGLAGADIDLRAVSLADTAEFGILRLIVDTPERALEIFKEAKYLVKLNEVIAVDVGDKPGALAGVLRLLSEADVDVEYTYAFLTQSRDSACVILRVSDNSAAITALNIGGVSMLTAEDVYGM